MLETSVNGTANGAVNGSANGVNGSANGVDTANGVNGTSGANGANGAAPGRVPVPVPPSPRAALPLTVKDFKTDQEVRWCPGCGDYAILAAVQGLMPTLGIKRENLVFISGIGCSSRFPYYMNTYGMHSIHGRAPTIATGLAVTRPDLSVWVVTGDGDALSIGGNHLIHALRRNVNLKILLFNNRIYGLTKGQYSPTSEQGKITKSTPVGSPDTPFNPLSLALGAEAGFLARSIDSDRKHLTEVLAAAAAHQGTALVEIYQNCNIFNDGAFDPVKDPATRDARLIRLAHGQPVLTGDGRKAVRTDTGGYALAPESDPRPAVVHDAHVSGPEHAFALSRLADPTTLDATAIGILRDIQRPTYDQTLNRQLEQAHDQHGRGDLTALLAGNDTWSITGN
ncbi:2-oxoacid:ferredoxin oxidoreductase subunit beta [Actinocrinis puniceicyclus]|uniref:2-oxoacid:ferredoxin oxidoreductase subunit beta n=1 Tax=Actinocrinis puniceicyclus TaxID=977794 RepID=A0A8J7WHH4_9ACTN|nr:2-oxoacid:ferredoxin oxidoreductase subunit beta [Actinocrinis puniceicyclus]MBS2962216.1 2-oxoacid:ferredoxin oxidoreductase subunit beta [Actinocrinis puniceicyclus]